MRRTLTRNGFTFELETYNQAGNERPVSVVGRLITKRTSIKTKNPPAPLCYAKPDAMPKYCDRGHIVAEQFGGPNIPENIVPMLSSFNRRDGDWKQVEGEVSDLLRTSQVKYIAIRLLYPGENPIPNELIVRCSLTPTVGAALDDRSDLDNGVFVRKLNNMPTARTPFTLTDDYASILEPALRDFRSEAKMAENQRVDNAFLDYLNEIWLPQNGRSQICQTVEMGTPAKFSSDQRKWILALNAYQNRDEHGNGWISSQDPDDPYQELNMRGCLDVPEIDHVRPYSMGGSNRFDNAQVLSAKRNSAKRARYILTESENEVRRRSSRFRDNGRYDPYPDTSTSNCAHASGA